jgi:hypothetical protein
MKKAYRNLRVVLIITLTHLLISSSILAQSPQKMSYQAVIRNSSDQLVTNHALGMQISILQGSPTGTAVYVETQTPSTNANGLVSIEIGGGTVTYGDFSTIDWSTGTYYIKTETDPAGGTTYSITGTSQILSVPYALHAKTVASYPETDPVFAAHASSGITSGNITNWNTAFSWGDHATEGYFANGGETVGTARILGNKDDFSLGIKTNDISRIFIANDGKIGIGTTTPSELLEVAGKIKATGGMDAGSNVISNVADPSDPQDAATKAYVDVSAETNANLTGMVTSVGNETTVVTNADLTGEVTSVGNTTTVSNSAVIGKVLTGFTSGAGTVDENDNILEAIQKLDGNNPVHYIGEKYGGGIVFYVYDNGQHGLIAAAVDQSTACPWGAGSGIYTLATSDGVGAGKANTAIILALQGVGDGSMYAAKVCFRYWVLDGGVRYSDWYLPSKHELNLLFNNRGYVGGFIETGGYWSSTEATQGEAWAQGFLNGTQIAEAKGESTITHARAIRAF